VSKIHLLSTSSVDWLRQQAKALKKSQSITQSQALHQISIQQGFTSWKDLIDTFKFEAGIESIPKRFFAVVKNDYSDLKVFEDEATVIQKKLLATQGIDLEKYQSNMIPFIESDLTSGTNFHNLISEASHKAQLEIAQKHGFPSWDDLQKKYVKHIILEKYTDEQKIGAVARTLDINPKTIKNTIHVAIEIDNDGLMDCSKDDWEKIGFIEDHDLSHWIYENDRFFGELGFVMFFRVISIDTDSFVSIEHHLDKIHEHLEIFFPVFASCVWINGEVDPQYLIPESDYPDEPLPLPQIPVEIWKKGY
jgi:hypothetical protein